MFGIPVKLIGYRSPSFVRIGVGIFSISAGYNKYRRGNEYEKHVVRKMLPHVHPFWSNMIADWNTFFELAGGFFILGGLWTWRFCAANLTFLGLLYFQTAQHQDVRWFQLPSVSNPRWEDVGCFWYFLAYSTVLVLGPGRYSKDFQKHISPPIFRMRALKSAERSHF